MISLFPINMITDRPQGRDDLRTQRKETGREREGKGRERKYYKRLPVREMSSFWWKCSCHDFCYGLKCWNCFQSEKLSCLSLRIGNGSISEWKHQQAQQCNAIFSTLSRHSNPTNTVMSCSLVQSLFHKRSFFIQFTMKPGGCYSVACLVY